jgi:hypothetical protein
MGTDPNFFLWPVVWEVARQNSAIYEYIVNSEKNSGRNHRARRRVVVPARHARLHGLAGRNDNPLPELILSPKSGLYEDLMDGWLEKIWAEIFHFDIFRENRLWKYIHENNAKIGKWLLLIKYLQKGQNSQQSL